MTPESERLIAAEIEHLQALLTIEYKSLLGQPYSVVRDQRFSRINFWRIQYDRAKAAIVEPEEWEHWTSDDWKKWALGKK